jgi:death-on-curing protein
VDVIYLSVEIVKGFHERALKEHGGIAGLRSKELLESAVFQPQQSAFGEDAYPTLASKAAAYGFFIAQNQPFLDGNKRTAAASMLAFLYLNGCIIDQTDDQIYEAFIGLGTRELSQANFFAWVESHVGAEH